MNRPAEKDRIKIALVERLYDQGYIGMVATFVNASVLVFLLRDLISHTVLTYWLSATLLSILMRLVLVVLYRKYSQKFGSWRTWETFFIAGLALSGLIWGAAGILLFPINSTVHQVFIAFVLAGMVAGAVGAFSSQIWAFIAFSFPALLPLLFNFLHLSLKDETHTAMAAMTFLFLILTFFTAKRINVSTKELVSLKEQFAEMLSERTVELLKSNRKLEKEVEERKITEKALRESEEKYRLVVENAREGILVTQAGRVVFINSRVLDLSGYTLDDLETMNFADILYPDDREAAIKRYLKILGGERDLGDYEYRVIDKHDGIRWTRSSSVPIEWKGNRAVLTFMSEITEKKEAEIALKESERRFRDLFESITDLVYTQDLDGRFLSLNHLLLESWGYSYHDLIGRDPKEIMDPDSRPLFEGKYLEKLKKEGHYQGIAKFFTKDGRKFYIEFKSKLVEREDGGTYISGIGREVTDRIIAERKISELQEQMLQAKKMEAIGTLAGGIAHDFNNLLMGIQGNASMLLFDLDPEQEKFDKIKKKVSKIEKLVQDGANLTNQLLGFARGGKYESKPADLNRIIVSHNLLFGRTRKEMRIHEDLERDLWHVEIDKSQIEQALLNIYLNAWQAMPLGGDAFVKTENVVLKEEEASPLGIPEGKYVKVSITDSGTGMDENTRQRIFEPFFTTKGMGRGTGLGLASVYGIVKNHGGFIDVNSEKEKGTTFTIYLPVAEEKTEKGEDGRRLTARDKWTVMLVDDEEIVLDISKMMLEKLGYKVLTAKGGKEALMIYKEKREEIHIVILDMIMPDMSGGQTYDKLKKIDPAVKVLLSSGYAVDGKATKILDRGCNGFIQKPFRMENIDKKIMEVLGE